MAQTGADRVEQIRERRRAKIAELKHASGGLLDSAQVAALLQIDEAEVEKRRRKQTLMAVHDYYAGGGWMFPAVQFDDAGRLLTGIPETLRSKVRSDNWDVLDFLLTGREELDGDAPIDAMRQGGLKMLLLRRLLARFESDSY